MRNLVLGILSAVLGAVLVGVMAWFIVMPPIDWGAAQRTGATGNMLASRIIARRFAYSASAAER
jgi:hypothetical protein